MSSSEKFNLKWNDFEGNISGGLRELRDDKDFFDVTLATDGDQISAHKVILAACSPFFRNVLRRNPHQHPLLYMKGVRYTDLQSVLDFMYHGEVNIAQEDLNGFLAVAEDLRVKGLTQGQGGGQSSNSSKPQSEPYKPKREETKRPVIPSSSSRVSQQMAVDDDIQEVVPVKTEPGQAHAQYQEAGAVGGELQQFDTGEGYEEGYEDYGQYDDTALVEQGGAGVDAVKGHLQKFEDFDQYVRNDAHGSRYCGICLIFKTNHTGNLRNHIESKHFQDAFTYQCPECKIVLNTNKAYLVHRSRTHMSHL